MDAYTNVSTVASEKAKTNAHGVLFIKPNAPKTSGIYSYDNGKGHEGPSEFIMPDGTPFTEFVKKEMYKGRSYYLGHGFFSNVWKLKFGDIEYILKISEIHYVRSFAEQEAASLSDLSTGEVSRYVNKLITAQIEPDVSYMLIEYVPGMTMTEWLKMTPNKEEYTRIYNQLETGLELIHAAGYVHYDIKSDNIWIPTDSSRPPLFIDFGISNPIGKAIAYKNNHVRYASVNVNKIKLSGLRPKTRRMRRQKNKRTRKF